MRSAGLASSNSLGGSKRAREKSRALFYYLLPLRLDGREC